jgi:hypothetical protein
LVADPTHLQYRLRDLSMVGENRLRWKILVYGGGYLFTGRETRLRSGIHVKGKGYSSKQKGRLVTEGGYSSTDWQTSLLQETLVYGERLYEGSGEIVCGGGVLVYRGGYLSFEGKTHLLNISNQNRWHKNVKSCLLLKNTGDKNLKLSVGDPLYKPNPLRL